MTRRAERGRAPRAGAASAPAASRPAAAQGWLAGPAFVRLSLALITLAAAALRLWALSFQPTVTFDGTEYVRFADALGHGQRFASVFAPGYPLLAALVHVVVPDRVTAAVLVSMLAGTALPAIVWALAREPLGARGALLPAALCALHPELARHSAITMSESAYISTLYLGIALLAARSARSAVGGGLALGFAYAIRPEGLVSAAALAVAGVRAAALDARARRRVFVAALACALVVIGCVAWYHATLGGWTLTPKTAALHAAAQDWHAVEPRLGGPIAGTLPLGARVLGSLRGWPANAWRQAQALLWSWPWPLLLLSLWGLLRRRGPEASALVYLPLLPFLGLSQQGRFSLAAIPALAISACVALLRESSRWRRVGAAALAAFGIIACGWALEDAFRTPFDGGVLTDMRAGRWLAKVAAPGDVVIDRKPFVAFYAGCRQLVLATGPYDEVVDGMVKSGAEWLVLEDYVVHQMRPELAPLLDSAAWREREPRLELVYARADAGQGSLGIFRVLRPGSPRRGVPPVVEMEGFANPAAGPRIPSP